MTKPKFRPCPSCQVHQQANRKTCSVCFATLPSKRKLQTAHINVDWGQRVIKNKNASRVVASAQIAVQKLSALGYMPILFISQRHKGTGKLVADVVTHLPPTQANTGFLTKCIFLLTSQQMCPSHNETSTLPETSPSHNKTSTLP
ncbi:hypothetical protein G5714_004612 [Onychostoma macrolepis]|uniref:Uncharacterized protein n=1 Tax=Onychostoma macrolepis TaxID=369639 RepID=A0A7J6D547_9TELE|nr:hypothetical protein G5714_004612 [Onychostoma macrolepis]